MRGYYAGFVTRALALIIDLLIIFVASLIFNLIVRLLLNFFGLSALATAVYDRTAVSDTQASSLLVTFMRWATAFFTSATFLFVYLVFFWTVIGKTPGKMILGLRVVQSDSETVPFKAAVVRAFGYYVSLIALGMGFFWVLIDEQRRGWHDKMAHTYVLYDWDARLGRRLIDRLRRMRAGQLASSAADMVREQDDAG
jgi:uncharacterized RDD family membrane protein YckC